VARAWSERPVVAASEGDWLLPYLSSFGTVGGVVGSHWPRYAVLPPTADQASDGELDPTLAATLREVLGRHTDDPGDCLAALWEGWGLVTGGMSMSWLSPGTSDAPLVRMGPTLPVEVVNAPRFSPPHRGYLLFGATFEELGPAPVATTDNWAGSHGPSLFWPTSRQWCLGVEIDVVVTIVGGSDALVDDLLTLPGAVEVDSLERLRREWHADGFPFAEDL
jgi:hypothetical protein